MSREPLPEFFTVSSAHAAGWSRRQRDGDALERPFHGVRSVTAFDAGSLSAEQRTVRRAKQYAVTMSAGAFFSHTTAAVLWGLPLPARILDDGIDVSVWTLRRSPRGRGVRGHQLDRRLVSAVVHPAASLVVTSPASTWALLGAVISHPYDLVAIGDAIIRTPQHRDDPPAMATLAQLVAVTDAGRRPGVGILRAALPQLRPGASSRPETWVRLTLVDAGLPEPALALEVFDASGQFVARLDLAYPEEKVAIEYEGEHHLRDPAQWADDIRRLERLAAAGWHVIRVTKEELFVRPEVLVGRVRRAMARARAPR